jgi:hypothetical protein
MVVYIIQDQKRYDRETGQYVAKFDLSPASEYGTMRFLLSPTASPFHPERVMPDLWHGLRDYSDDDHLLLVGNPILIGWATAIAADVNEGRVRLLQWSGKDQRYLSVNAQVFELDDEDQVA